MIDLTPVFNAAIALVAVLLTTFLVPWIKTKLSKEQTDSLLSYRFGDAFAHDFVFSADELRCLNDFLIDFHAVMISLPYQQTIETVSTFLFYFFNSLD